MKPAAEVVAATRATYAAFAIIGFAFASWASRIPQVQQTLDLSPRSLGLVLLAIAAGSIVALPMSGMVVARRGSRGTVRLMAVINAASLAVVAVGHTYGVVPLLVGLFGFGCSHGAWDVAMNVQGAAVERRLRRSIMARFHAGFSIGTVGGALTGAAMVWLKVPVTWHLLAVAAACVAIVPWAVRTFLPDRVVEQATESTEPEAVRRRHPLAAWTEPRTLLVGVFVLAFGLAEGVANDWVAVALIDDLDALPSVGTIGFSAFLAAMTVSRWIGPRLLDRYGRVPVIRVMTVLALAGVVTFVLAETVPVAVAGVVLWGLGIALGFPMGMSAGSDEPERAAARVSVIASIGYCSFLAGPTMIGFLGEQIGVQQAVISLAVLLVVALLISGAVRPPHPGAATSRQVPR